MAKLKITTGDGAVVPGKDQAEKHKAEQEAQQEKQSQSLFAEPKRRTRAQDGPDYGYSRIRLHKKDEINPYADEQDARLGMDPRTRTIIIMAVVMLVVFVVSAVLPTNLLNPMRTHTSIGSLAEEVASSFQGIVYTLMGGESMYSYYFFGIITTLLAGAALGLSGGVYQGSLKNALASPSTLGVMNGGTLGLIIYAVFVYPNTIYDFNGRISDYQSLLDSAGPVGYFMQYYGGFVCSLIGCAVVVGLIMLIALIAGKGKVSNASLVIAGQVFAAVITVIITWIKNYLITFGDEDMVLLLEQTNSSSFTGTYTLFSVLCFAIPLFICMAIVFAQSSRLSLLAFNDEEARSMGISTAFTRNLTVGLCTVMTALVISFCGAIGFVGFMVPHIARHMVGPDFRYLLPACSILGAIMVCVVYVFTEMGIPGIVSGSTGTWTSIVGCVMFIIMALRQRGSANGQWL